MRVLLIEDDSATAQSIELMLKSESFNVYTTDLGEEGVDLGTDLGAVVGEKEIDGDGRVGHAVLEIDLVGGDGKSAAAVIGRLPWRAPAPADALPRRR